MVVCTQARGEGIRHLGTRVPSVYEQFRVGTGTQIQVTCKISTFLENSKGQQTLDTHPTHCIPPGLRWCISVEISMATTYHLQRYPDPWHDLCCGLDSTYVGSDGLGQLRVSN